MCVAVPLPILSVMAFDTLPVAGSFTVRTCRLISRVSPTFSPVLLPTLIISVFPLTSATSPDTETFTVGRFPAAVSSCVAVSATAACTASPKIVCPKLLLPISSPAAPPLPPPAPAPISDVPDRCDSPFPVTAAKISPVVVFTKRAVMPTTALDFLVPIPPSPNLDPYPPYPPPPILGCWSSRPNCVMLPMMMASTPRILPIFAAVEASARSLLEKFCSPSTLSSALRSITDYVPSCTSLYTNMSEMPLPTSWSVPKIACVLDLTVPYSKFSTATRFFCAQQGPATRRRSKANRRNLDMGQRSFCASGGSKHNFNGDRQPSGVSQVAESYTQQNQMATIQTSVSPRQLLATLIRSFSRLPKFVAHRSPPFDPRIQKLCASPQAYVDAPCTIHRALYRASPRTPGHSIPC